MYESVLSKLDLKSYCRYMLDLRIGHVIILIHYPIDL